MKIRRRTAALLEVLGVFLSGSLVVTLSLRLLGLQVPNPLGNFTVGITDAELLTAARQLFVLLILQYAGYFVLIIPINWWHRRSGPAAYGLTLAGHSWRMLLLAGIATAALAEWPVLTAMVVNAILPLARWFRGGRRSLTPRGADGSSGSLAPSEAGRSFPS